MDSKADQMRALTVRSPWGWAIARGWKPVENRSRELPRSLVGVPIALHAGLGQDETTLPAGPAAQALSAAQADADPMCARGAVIAVVRFAPSHPHQDGHNCSPWAMDSGWHWPVGSVVPLAQPVPCRGALGFWRLQAAVLAAVQDQAG